MLGYVFNPVSFWVCHDHAGAVRAVLCEVRNTFGERHNYLVATPDGRPLVSGETFTARKMFHVSPFCEVKGRLPVPLSLRCTDAGSPASITSTIDDAAEPLLETWISGDGGADGTSRRSPSLVALSVLHRGVVARIHWQALKLALKRVPFFAKPAPPREETTR